MQEKIINKISFWYNFVSAFQVIGYIAAFQFLREEKSRRNSILN